MSITWTNEDGDVIDPNDITIIHETCDRLDLTYFVTAVCLDDSTQVVTDEVFVTVYATDITGFFTVIEEPCFVGIDIDSACVEYLMVDGDIPVINPGDVGSTTVTVIQGNGSTCASEEVELSWDCTCSIENLSVVPGECNNGQFNVFLQFDVTSAGTSFTVTDQDGNDLGTFNYTDLPLLLGPFNGDPTIFYTFTVQDTEFPDCSETFELGSINCGPNCNATIKGPYL